MTRKVMPHELIVEIQKYTDFPWWNGQAYVTYRGFDILAREAGNVVDDLGDVIEWLRSEEQYEKSDRLRTIRKRLNDALGLPSPKDHRI